MPNKITLMRPHANRTIALLAGLKEIPGTSWLRETVADCLRGDYACQKSICPKCSEARRDRLVDEVRLLHQGCSDSARVITVHIAYVDEGALSKLDLGPYRRSLRTRLTRAFGTSLVGLGGIEVAWLHRRQEWHVHCHMFVAAAPRGAVANLRSVRAYRDIKRAVHVDKIRDFDRQISYCFKCLTAHQPAKRRSQRRPPMVPLRGSILKELVDFYERHSPEQLTIKIGTRRR